MAALHSDNKRVDGMAPLKLSIEPSFLQEKLKGNVIYDIVDGVPVFEPKKDAATKLRESLAKIVADNGADFATLTIDNVLEPVPQKETNLNEDDLAKKVADSETPSNEPISYDDLTAIRQEALMSLDVAAGELSQALDVINLLLSTTRPEDPSPHQILPSAAISASFVTPPDRKTSVQAMDAQLVIGSKDSALRRASGILSRAASSVSTFVDRGEIHWGQAILMRRANWGLIPKPLPPGVWPLAQRKDLEHGTRDFLISYGLEDSPPQFRRKAMASLGETSTSIDDPEALIFPSSHRRRLRVGLVSKNTERPGTRATNAIDLTREINIGLDPLDARLSAAQKEIVEEELFAQLIKEAGSFPSAAAYVSERRISIEAAKDIELTLELVNINDLNKSSAIEEASEVESEDHFLCSFILHTLTLLLIRHHRFRREQRRTLPPIPFQRSSSSSAPPQAPRLRPPPAILAPIISLLQYRSFCFALRADLNKMCAGLVKAGIDCLVTFSPVGENAADVLNSLDNLNTSSAPDEPGGSHSWLGLDLSGEAIIWIDNRHTLRFTFASPTTLTLHLPHATLPITNLGVMRSLLVSEVGLRVLTSLKVEGEAMFGGRWSLDRLDPECTGEWDDVSWRLMIQFGEDLVMSCASLVETKAPDGTLDSRVDQYSDASSSGQGLKSWFEDIGRSLGV